MLCQIGETINSPARKRYRKGHVCPRFLEKVRGMPSTAREPRIACPSKGQAEHVRYLPGSCNGLCSRPHLAGKITPHFVHCVLNDV